MVPTRQITRQAQLQVQRVVRRAHLAVAPKALPPRLGIYFHDLPAERADDLRRLAELLAARGYRIATDPDDYLASATPVAWISFDDNYRTWYEGLPLLAELGWTATFYTNTEPLRDDATPEAIAAYFGRIEHHGAHEPLSRAELTAIAEAGHCIGAHTHTHVNLAAVSRAEALADIARNKAELEALLERPVRHLSYPFGLRRYCPDWLPGELGALGFATLAAAAPGLLHEPPVPSWINRTPWRFERGFAANVDDLRVDGRRFERLTGRSAVG
jgi:peptidoglycan/xylan/chitin deacetylase (PgdA/CDA1 family)